MPTVNFDDALDKILAKNPRYDRQAYIFMHMALGYTQWMLAKDQNESPRHITGQELLNGIRSFASDSLGSAARTTLKAWGIHTCRDFGEIVFLMVEFELMGKTEQDSITDFENGYDLNTAFPAPFYYRRWFWVFVFFGVLALGLALFLIL
jgi:uncharacterized repeat protein (TIGR04138 family)